MIDQNTTPGYVVAEDQIESLRQQGYEVEVSWGGGDKSWAEWQKRVINCTCHEVGLFGGKASGKSTAMRAWMISGNPGRTSQNGTLTYNDSYTYHPDFWGLILRKNEKDLQFFLREAQRMYAPIGGEWKNGHFGFPSGARIDAGHMADENAWHKYIGNEYQRVAIDEAALIPEYGPIEELRSGMRTPLEDQMRIQTVYASNCGGPGTGWIMSRFMEVKSVDGTTIPHDTIIRQRVRHPFTGETTYFTRIWIFATIKDNPAMARTWYAAGLENLTDPKRQRAYFYGLWDAFYGSYFSDVFRPKGPILENGEPVHANHVVEAGAVKLEDWWHRSISMDWGYTHESAILWACQEPKGRLHIYRELGVTQTSPERIGVEIGTQTRDELHKLPSQSITLWLSHDAFAARGGGRSYAELVALGLMRVLGPKAVHLPDVMVDNIQKAYDSESDFSVEAMKKRDLAVEAVLAQKRAGITIRKAEKINVIGWQFCREIMRWREIKVGTAPFDEQKYHQLMMIDPAAANTYATFYKDRRPEKLPKLQIWDCCPRLIEALPKAQHKDGTEKVDDKHFTGKDFCDSFHYLIMGMRDENPSIPKQHYLMEAIDKITETQPTLDLNSRIQILRQVEAEYAEKHKPLSPFSPVMGPKSQRAARKVDIARNGYTSSYSM